MYIVINIYTKVHFQTVTSERESKVNVCQLSTLSTFLLSSVISPPKPR